MANVANLRINAIVNDQATPALRRINGALNGLNSGMSGASGGALGAARALTGVGSGASMAAVGIGVAVAATAALVAGTAAVIKSSIDAAAKTESYRNTLLRLTGDAAKADEVLRKLQDFADWSPFDDEAVMQSAQRLLGAGVAADDLTKVMTALSDVSGDSAETFQRASVAFSQMALKGKVSQEELNQFAEAGIPAQKLLADAMGVTSGALGDMIQKGLVPANKALPLLIDAIGNKFGGATERASQSTKGLRSTLSAGLERSFANLGKAIEPLTKDVLTGLIELVKDVQAGIVAFTSTEDFTDFLNATRDAGRELIAALRPMLTLFGEMFRAALPYLTIAMKAFAVVLRMMADTLNVVNRALKPVWDLIRAVGVQVKTVLGYIAAFVTAFSRIGKSSEDGTDGLSGFLAAINPFGPNLDGATRAAIALGDALAALVIYKTITFTVSLISGAAQLALTALTASLAAIQSTYTAVVVAVTAAANAAIAFTQAALNAIRGVYPAIIAVTVTIGAGLALVAGAYVIEGLVTNYQATVHVDADTKQANDALSDLEDHLHRATDPTWTAIVTASVGQAILDVASFITALATIPTQIGVGINIATTGIADAIAGIIDALAQIPRVITTVHRVIQQEAAVSDSTGPNATGLSVPPGTANAGSSATNDAMVRAALGLSAVGAAALAGMAMIGAGAGLGGGCFVAGTLVHRGDGSTCAIEEIAVGDEVLTLTLAGPVVTRVVEVLVHDDVATWDVRLNGETITTTANHLWLVDDGWREASNLQAGMSIVTVDERLIAVEQVQATGNHARVHNLHVDHEGHNYAVGVGGYVVHNFKSAADLTDIGRGASGAIVTQPTMALIGEAGPEALVPLDSMPGASPVGGLGGVNVDTVIINVSGYADGAGAGRAAADAFRRQLGLQRRLPFGTA